MTDITIGDAPAADAFVRLAAGGDEAAFARLVDRHHASMAKVAYAITGNVEAARDATQAAWSGDGRYLVVGSIPGAAWVLDVMRGQWQPLGTPIEAGGVPPIRWSPDGRLGIIEGAWLTIHSFDGTSERKVKLPGSTPTWSPDGRSIATLAEGSDGEAALLSTDAWETGESRQIAALRAADRSGSTPPGSETPCIQWQPDVQP